MRKVAYCLNPDPQFRHENRADGYYRCRVCNFLVEGAQLSGYKVLSFRGKGSFGDVYEVREPPPLGRILALKILNFDKSGTKANASIARDARNIASLRHPHILPVYQFGTLKDNRPYFSMELATTTLGNMFPMRNGSRKLASAEELVPFIEQAANALAFIHENNFVHQDIKPENLLIIDKPSQGEKQLFLSDFGIACFLGQTTQANLSRVVGLGTPEYMAPEQWEGQPVPATDQYALAISIYELLAGRRPFDHLNRIQLRFAQSQLAPPSPRQWNPRIPPEVESVLLRALAKDHRIRYRSIHDFAESYSQAAYIALERYACQSCGYQNRSGSLFCSNCGTRQDDRRCPFCDTPTFFGERTCEACKRLIFPLHIARNSELKEVSIRQGRYIIQHVLKKADIIPSPKAHYHTGPKPEDSKVMVAIACDTKNGDKQVILKRWACAEAPLDRRARDILHL